MTEETTRLQELIGDLRTAVDELILRHKVTTDEALVVIDWLQRTADAGELPLVIILFAKSMLQAADGASYERPPLDGASTWEMEGPAHLPGAPLLPSPAVLPMRDDEPGEPLVVSGTVRSTSGEPLSGAVLDVWQIDANNVYSGLTAEDFALLGVLPNISNDATDVPRFNLRGRVVTDADGRYEFRTVMPGLESFGFGPDSPMAQLADALRQPGDRPRHIHAIVTADGYLPLTTQLYFDTDPLVHTAIEGRIPPDTVKHTVRHDDAAELSSHGVTQPYLALTNDIVLRPESAAVPV